MSESMEAMEVPNFSSLSLLLFYLFFSCRLFVSCFSLFFFFPFFFFVCVHFFFFFSVHFLFIFSSLSRKS